MNDRPMIMAILNVTRDSFSGDGLLSQDNIDLTHNVRTLIQQGADILDIGGESTRPGSHTITAEEEIKRISPLINKVKNLFPRIRVSVDTYKPEVAEEALTQGADILNDINGGEDTAMLDLAARHQCPIILMHNKSKQDNISYQEGVGYSYKAHQETEHLSEKDYITSLITELTHIIQHAKEHCVQSHNIIIDPGLGFGKTVEQNYFILRNIHKIRNLHPNILIGASRKSFIGHYTGTPPENRDTASAIAHFQALMQGARIIRAHNVQTSKSAVDMFNAFTLNN